MTLERLRREIDALPGNGVVDRDAVLALLVRRPDHRDRVCKRCGATYRAGSYRSHRDDTHPAQIGPGRAVPDPARDGAIVAFWRDGANLVETGAEFGISRERVRQILARNGVGSGRHATPARVRVCGVCGAEYTGLYVAHVRAAVHPATLGAPGHSAATLEMAEAYRRGESIATTAARYGVKPGTVRAAARRLGVPSRRKGFDSVRRNHDVLADLRAGMPNWLVAERYGLTPRRVSELRGANGIAPASASPDRPLPPGTAVQTMRRTGDVRAALRGG